MGSEEKRYKAVCPVCDKDIYVCKSIGQMMGFPQGHGSCPHCNTFLYLGWNEEKQEFDDVKPWDIYINEVEVKK